MASQSVARTHPFYDSSNRLFRVAESDGVFSLEDGEGDLVDRCYITGPEILKLSEQGRRLWEALDGLLRADTPAAYDRAHSLARVALEQTAAKPEASVGEILDAFKRGIDAGPLGSPEYLEAAGRRQHNPERPIPLVPEVPRGDD